MFPYWSIQDSKKLEELREQFNKEIKRIEKAESELTSEDLKSTKDIEFSDLTDRLNTVTQSLT